MMMMTMRYMTIIVISWIAISLFMIGFFLTRKELLIESLSCNGLDICLQAKYSRVIMFIVDALRLDMILSKDTDNKMNFQFMNDMLVNNSSQVHLFGFQADPPTTTSQRLKGLTTGSLPTFLDISQNFNSKSIKEDNIIDQFYKAKKKLVVLGDDTWSSLYPDQFHIRYPFDSFNTRDIHTVDDGIESHMWDHLHDKGQWDVFIAHFLGVDHIGHTYSSSHPYMSQRLQRMDHVLKKVVDSMDNDTLLLLFGDHGMTDDGNHGGSSYEEITSGLFAYSKQASTTDDILNKKSWDEKQGKFHVVDNLNLIKQPRLVRQIDLVPTLSLLMGIPIPFSNMGKIIPEFFDNGTHLLTAFLLNSMQVINYIMVYFGSSIDKVLYEYGDTNEMDVSLIQYCYNQKNETTSNCLMNSLVNKFKGSQDNVKNSEYLLFDTLLTSYQSFGRKKWTEFDVYKILCGLILLIVITIETVKSLFIKVTKTYQTMESSMYATLAVVCALIFSLSSFSNSFIEQEKRILFIFIQALNVTIFLDIVFVQGTTTLSLKSVLNYLLPTMLCICCIRYAWTSHSSDMTASNSFKLYLLWGTLNFLLVVALIRAMQRWSRTILSLLLFVISQLLLVYYLHNTNMNVYWIPRTILMLSLMGIMWSMVMRSIYCNNNENKMLHLFVHLFSISILTLLTAKGNCNADVLFVSILFFGFSVEMLRHYYLNEGRKSSSSLMIFGWVIHMCLFGRLLFFLTGHRYDFSSLQLDAGFILTDSFNFYMAGLMLSLNTFISEILGIVAILILANYLEQSYQMKEIIILSITSFKLSTLLFSCLSAFLLRRHLMVWAIFAPKVIFEISFWLVSSLILLFT